MKSGPNKAKKFNFKDPSAWNKHRNKWQSRWFWKRFRLGDKKTIKKDLEENS